jgi:RsiW-degrading membrane proteinase PrsW (M82 family)
VVFFLTTLLGFSGGYYTFLAIMNGIAAFILWRKKNAPGWALVWSVFAGVMMILASLALSASKSMVPALPMAVRSLVNSLSGPGALHAWNNLLYLLGFSFSEVLCPANGSLGRC